MLTLVGGTYDTKRACALNHGSREADGDGVDSVEVRQRLGESHVCCMLKLLAVEFEGGLEEGRVTG